MKVKTNKKSGAAPFPMKGEHGQLPDDAPHE